MNLVWPCDSLQPTECGKSDTANCQPRLLAILDPLQQQQQLKQNLPKIIKLHKN